MKNPIRPTNTIHSIRNPLTRSPWRYGLLLLPFALALAWFALLPTARAVDPPPDGCYLGANTAEGCNALFSLTSGLENTAIGADALFHNTTGDANTATGFRALFSNTDGNANTATGADALLSNTTGDANTATGGNALEFNTNGSGNTANGASALQNNETGRVNTANGFKALFSNTTGTAFQGATPHLRCVTRQTHLGVVAPVHNKSTPKAFGTGTFIR